MLPLQMLKYFCLRSSTQESKGLLVRPGGFEPPTFYFGGFHSYYESITYLHHSSIRSSIFARILRRLPRIGGVFGGVVNTLPMFRLTKPKMFWGRDVCISQFVPPDDECINGHTERPFQRSRVRGPPHNCVSEILTYGRASQNEVCLREGGLTEGCNRLRLRSWRTDPNPQRPAWEINPCL